MPLLRIAACLAVAALLLGCGREPSASELTAKGVANLTSAKTVHLDGTGSIALKGHYRADTTKMIEELRKSAGATTQAVTNPQGTGELWIRIDDSQIVRQLVTLSMDIDGLAALLPASASNVGKASVEMSLDMRFSNHGGAIPQITAPPVGR